MRLGLCPCLPSRQSVVPAGLALSRKAAGAGRVRPGWLGTGWVARSSTHRSDAGLAAQGGSASPPRPCKNLSSPCQECSVYRKWLGLFVFLFFFFFKQFQKASKLAPKKLPVGQLDLVLKSAKLYHKNRSKVVRKQEAWEQLGQQGGSPGSPQPSGMGPGPGLAHGACGWLLSAQSQLSQTAQRSWRKAAAGCAALGSHTTECSPVGRFQSRPLREAGGWRGVCSQAQNKEGQESV